MGKWQKVILKRKKAEVTSSTSGTVTLDLPEKDYISQLTVIPYHTNTTLTNDGLIPCFNAIKKIEVLNGSEVIKSLSGSQVQALAYYHGRTNPCPHRQDWSSTETYDYFFTRFGRYPEDLEYILDMAALVNPQLKITYDFVTTSYLGRTYDCPTDPYFKWSVLADIYRGALPPARKGFIRSQQIEDWIWSTTTTTKYVDIPRTEPVCGLMMQGGYTDKRLLQDFNRIRLNLDTGAEIPIDVYEEEIMALQDEWFKPSPLVRAHLATHGDARVDTGLGEILGVQIISREMWTWLLQIQGNYGGFLYPQVWDVVAAAKDTTTMGQIFVLMHGLFPHHTVYLPAEKVTSNGKFTLDAPSYSKILLELTSATADTTVPKNVVLETVGP